MKRNIILLFVFSLLGSVFSFVPVSHSQNVTKTASAKSTYTLSAYEQKVFNLVNKERKKHNQKPLKLSLKVSKLAREKSEDMRDKNYYDHHSPTYGDPCPHMQKKGVKWSYCGENITASQPTPEEAMKVWMDSKGHRENILSKNYTHIGVGYAKGGKYKHYWTQQFYG
jgi:uncharacterized YkwD family protein